MRYSFHFPDQPDSDHSVELATIEGAKLMALQCLLDVARDEAPGVPFRLAVSVSDERGGTVCQLSLQVEPGSHFYSDL